MKQLINFDDETGAKLKDYVYSRKANGESITISSFVRDCVKAVLK